MSYRLAMVEVLAAGLDFGLDAQPFNYLVVVEIMAAALRRVLIRRPPTVWLWLRLTPPALTPILIRMICSLSAWWLFPARYGLSLRRI